MEIKEVWSLVWYLGVGFSFILGWVGLGWYSGELGEFFYLV